MQFFLADRVNIFLSNSFSQLTIMNATSNAKICQKLIACRVAASSNNHMHSNSKKHRSFLALFFAAGDVRR